MSAVVVRGVGHRLKSRMVDAGARVWAADPSTTEESVMSQNPDFSSEPLDPDAAAGEDEGAGADPADEPEGSETERGAESVMEQVGEGFDAAIEGHDSGEARGT
jgi:hypothetical protein